MLNRPAMLLEHPFKTGMSLTIWLMFAGGLISISLAIVLRYLIINSIDTSIIEHGFAAYGTTLSLAAIFGLIFWSGRSKARKLWLTKPIFILLPVLIYIHGSWNWEYTQSITRGHFQLGQFILDITGSLLAGLTAIGTLKKNS